MPPFSARHLWLLHVIVSLVRLGECLTANPSLNARNVLAGAGFPAAAPCEPLPSQVLPVSETFSTAGATRCAITRGTFIKCCESCGSGFVSHHVLVRGFWFMQG